MVVAAAAVEEVDMEAGEEEAVATEVAAEDMVVVAVDTVANHFIS